MRKSYRKVLLVSLISILISFIWLRNSHLFPKPPEFIALFIVDLFGAANQEEIANIEFFYIFIISTIIVALVVLLPYKKILTILSKGRS